MKFFTNLKKLFLVKRSMFHFETYSYNLIKLVIEKSSATETIELKTILF